MQKGLQLWNGENKFNGETGGATGYLSTILLLDVLNILLNHTFRWRILELLYLCRERRGGKIACRSKKSRYGRWSMGLKSDKKFRKLQDINEMYWFN